MGVKFRAPGFLATSFERSVAERFQKRAAAKGVNPTVIWCIQLDKRGEHNLDFRCRHGAFICPSNTVVGGEKEYLFTHFAPFLVIDVQWSDTPTLPETPHQITLQTCLDSSADDTLPLSPWN